MTVSPLHRAALPGDFDEFYRQYFVRVLVLIRRHFPACDAEEIAQETMARCYTTYETIDPDRDPWNYVSSVARNAAIDSLRRNRRLVSTDELPEASRDIVDQTYDAVLVLERRRTLRDALLRLRAADRQLLIDHELEGMAYTEMAELREMAPNTLRQQVFRARGRLASELRRVGASLGVLPVAVHHKLGRLGRRWSDFSVAAGPVSASAFSALAIAGVATVATVLGGPAAPAIAAASPPVAVEPGSRDVVARSSGAVSPTRPDRPARPARAQGAAAAPRAKTPPPPPRPTIPKVTVQFEHHGNPTDPGGPSGHVLRVPTPVGTIEHEHEMGWLPGYGVLCWADVTTCPEEP